MGPDEPIYHERNSDSEEGEDDRRRGGDSDGGAVEQCADAGDRGQCRNSLPPGRDETQCRDDEQEQRRRRGAVCAEPGGSFEEERDARKKYKVLFYDGVDLVPRAIDRIKLPKSFPKKVFFTLDVDGMDPSVLPATGTPVPGGLGWYQTLGLFESVARQRRLIGFDVMEYAPIEGFHAYDFTAALLTYKLMGIVERTSALAQRAAR